ncbi:MAG: hypothetical protein ABH870_02205 [bacterium]
MNGLVEANGRLPLSQIFSLTEAMDEKTSALRCSSRIAEVNMM